MKVIGVVGYPASGKSEFSQIAKENEIPVVVMGDIIRNRAKEKGLEPTDENLGIVASELRKELGMDAVAVLTVEIVKKTNAETVIIDGIRGDAEVKFFRSTFENFILIYIKTDFSVRMARVKMRKRSDDSAIEEFLLKRDEREESFGLKRATEMADVEISNENERRAYQIRIKRFLESIK